MTTHFVLDDEQNLWAVKNGDPETAEPVVSKSCVNPKFYNLICAAAGLYAINEQSIAPILTHGEYLETVGAPLNANAFIEIAAAMQLIKRSADEGLQILDNMK